MIKLPMFIAVNITKTVFAMNRSTTATHGILMTWIFLQDVYLTICGEIGRVSIPTRTKTRDGGLALRV